MTKSSGIQPDYGLDNHGLIDLEKTYWTLSSTVLIELAVQRGEGVLAKNGGLLVKTGKSVV